MPTDHFCQGWYLSPRSVWLLIVWKFRKKRVWGSILFRFYPWPFSCGLRFSLAALHQKDLGRQRKSRSWCGGYRNSPQTRASHVARVPLQSQHPTHKRTHMHTHTHTHTHAHTHPISISLSASPPACTGAQDGAVSQVRSQNCEGRWCRRS